MKKFKLFFILGLSLLFLFSVVIFKPIKTNYIYNKEISFSGIDFSDEKYDINDEKIIKKAEEQLNYLFGDEFSIEKYNVEVFFGNYSKDTSVSVLFFEKTNKSLAYAIGFDIDSGELIRIYNNENNDKTSTGKKVLSEKELMDIAVEYLSKINKYSKDDFVLEQYLDGNVCKFDVSLKSLNENFYIELNAKTGIILAYGVI